MRGKTQSGKSRSRRAPTKGEGSAAAATAHAASAAHGISGAPGGAGGAQLAEPRTTGRGVIDLMRAIKSGEVAPSSLGAEDRRACVEHLTGEGYGVAEIASVLGIADRTVARDRQRLREANAIARDPALVGQMAGRLMTEADTALSRIRRIARDKETPAASRLDAERSCWTIVRELVHTLQRLGYLPTAPMTLRADLTGQFDDLGDEALGVDELLEEAARLEAIARGAPAPAPGIHGGAGSASGTGGEALREGCKPIAGRPAARLSDGGRTRTIEAGGTYAADSALEEIQRVKDELARLALGSRLGRLSGALAKEGDSDDDEDQ